MAFILGVMAGLLIRTNQMRFLLDRLTKRKKTARITVTDNDPFWNEMAESDSNTGSDEEHDAVDLKLMLCVRTDLGMSKGKMCAQAGHAALGGYRNALRQRCPHVAPWVRAGQAKVAVKVKSEEEMSALFSHARQQGIPAYIIHDAGRTQIAAGSATVLAIGPAPASKLHGITGHLSLL